MNVLFLTLVGINSIEERGIYQDLLRKFRNEGHHVTIVTPVERRKKIQTNIRVSNGVNILQVKTLNVTRANIVEKGIGTLAIEYQYLAAIKKFLSGEKFDLILYSTPPVTFSKVIRYIRKRDGAYSYLLLKDIFPQNAVDMGMLRKSGFLHRQFLRKEKKLYRISDTIGCMSPANKNYIIKHNPEIDPGKVEVNPNSVEPVEIQFSQEEKAEIRKKYNLPVEKKILIYGGNLGRPQGIGFLLETIYSSKNKNIFFVVVGDGTEYTRIKSWFDKYQPANALLFRYLPKADYDQLLACCDVGMIFLDRNFTIPNFPSRLLSYLEMRKPVISATDLSTDIGDVIEEAGCGYKVEAGNIEQMNRAIDDISDDQNLLQMGKNAWDLLQRKYLVDYSYRLIELKLLKKDNRPLSK